MDKSLDPSSSARRDIARLIKLVGRCLMKLCSYEDPLESIPSVLRIMGEASGVTSTFFFECSTEEGRLLTYHRYTWVPAQELMIEDNQDFQGTEPAELGFASLDRAPSGYKELSLDDPEISEQGKQILKRHRVPSVLMIPVTVEGETRGLIGIASEAASRSWHEEEVSLLGMTAKCLGASLEKKIPIERLQRSERKYRELSSFLRLLADNMPDMLWAKDMQRRYVFANRAICERLLNASDTDEPVGRTDMFFAERERISHPDDPRWHTFGELCMDSDQAVMDSGVPQRFDEFGNVRGSCLYLDVHKAPMRNEEGEIIGTVGSAREVTREKKLESERMEAMKALQERERDLRDSHRMAGMGSWSFDTSSDKIMLSEEAGTLLGLDEGPSAKSVLDDMLPEEDSREFNRLLDEAVSAGERTLDMEHRLLKPDGGMLWIHSRLRIEYDSGGRPEKYFGVIQDITWRRKLEDEKIRLERRVLHAQKLESMGILAGGIAHDFNNILMGILGNADLALRDIPESSPAHDRIRGVIENSNVASELSNQMLAYSGRGSFRVEPVNLSDTVRSMENLLLTSISKNVTLTTRLCDDDTVVMGDMSQIRQIIMNLVLNASESYGEGNGTITLTTGRLECDEDCLSSTHPSIWRHQEEPPSSGEYVLIEVRDRGCGMDEVTLQRIFEPFFSTKFSGRGLGLAAVMGIVRSHGGLVSIESEPGRGSSFRILLPAGGKISSDMEDSIKESTPVSGGRILLVDDESSVRSVVTRMLERAGFVVLSAGTGQEALDIYRAGPDAIDCILLDLTMPRMSGTSCLEELRKQNPRVKVIISSGFTREDVKRRFTGQEFTGFIQKPYRYEDLMEVLSSTLDG